MPDLRSCPTGGFDLGKAPDYLELPNVACVGGSWMLPKDALRRGDYAVVEALAHEATPRPHAGLKPKPVGERGRSGR